MSSSQSTLLTNAMIAANNMHVGLYRISQGKFGNTVANLPVLLLTTLGRKSRKPRTHPIVYIEDGQDYLESASTGGMDWHPGWYFNLKTRPEVKIEIGDQTYNARAVITEGEERNRLYAKFKAASSNFDKYEKGTSRVIPVIRLTPVGKSLLRTS